MPHDGSSGSGGKTATFEMAEAEWKRKLAASALEVESLRRELSTARSISKGAASDATAALAKSRARVAELQAQLASETYATQQELGRYEEASLAISALHGELRESREKVQAAQRGEQRAVNEKQRLEQALQEAEHQLLELRAKQQPKVPIPPAAPRPPSAAPLREHQQLQARMRLSEESLLRAQVCWPAALCHATGRRSCINMCSAAPSGMHVLRLRLALQAHLYSVRQLCPAFLRNRKAEPRAPHPRLLLPGRQRQALPPATRGGGEALRATALSC